MNLYFTFEFRHYLDLISEPVGLKTYSSQKRNASGQFQMQIEFKV